jgi:hypothetical protein
MDYLNTFVARLQNEMPPPDAYVTRWPMLDRWEWAWGPPLAYIVTILLLRSWMSTRPKAFVVPKWFTALHNLFLVVLSGYMALETLAAASELGYGLVCNQVVPVPKGGERLARVIYIFCLSKIYEFVDTFIMILRKNDHQVTFLHTYHHATIYFVWWFNMRYSPGGDGFQSVFQNSTVHVVMYSYYFLRTVAPGGNYWWKKYITKGQIMQFVFFVTQGVYLLYSGCYPFPVSVFNTIYAFSLLALFVNFYIKSYKSKAAAKNRALKRDFAEHANTAQ